LFPLKGPSVHIRVLAAPCRVLPVFDAQHLLRREQRRADKNKIVAIPKFEALTAVVIEEYYLLGCNAV
jgi:hypothetical protein